MSNLGNIGNVTCDGKTVHPYEAAPFERVACIYTQAQVEAMVKAEMERCLRHAFDIQQSAEHRCDERGAAVGRQICLLIREGKNA